MSEGTPKLNIRRMNRTAAMQFLFSWEINPSDDVAAARYNFFNAQEQERDFFEFAEELVLGVIAELEVVDKTIEQAADNWNLSRIAKIDLAILRLSIFELLFRRDIPPVVSINEAIELSKVFSSPDSKRFINGVLDKVKDKLDRPLRTAAE